MGAGAAAVSQADAPPIRVTLNQQTELGHLLDLCAEQMSLRIEYDEKSLKLPVMLRLDDALSPDELWALANTLLASKGFAIVQSAGGNVLSVVPMAQAAERARIEAAPAGVEEAAHAAGYQTVVVRVAHQSAKVVVEALKLVLSKPGGSAAAIGDSGLILISDLQPRIEQALWILQSMDAPIPEPIIERIELRASSAAAMAAAAAAVVEARNSIVAAPLLGKVRPLTEGNALLVIAPAQELSTWHAIVAELDSREQAFIRSYVPRHFGLDDVARLIEETLGAVGSAGSRATAGQLRIVVDRLTGTLVITATAMEHEQIESLLARLDSAPTAARQPIRTFKIRHRPVKEMMDIVNQLLQTGALAGAGAVESDAASIEASARTQRSERDVLGPAMSAAASSTGTHSSTRSVDSAGSAGGLAEHSSPRNGVFSKDGASSHGLSLTADEATNTLIAIGDPRMLSQLESLLKTLDMRQPQVMLEVLVVSLTDGETLDLGVEIQKLEISGGTLVALSSLFGLGAPALGLGGPATPPASAGAGFSGLVLNPGDFSVLIRALQTLNDGRSLSMPRLLVSNNQQANLNSVLQQPFTSTNASDTVATTSFGGTQDAGTTMTIKPQIAEGDHLLLEYTISLSAFVGESSDGSLPPPRQQNSLSSTVSIPDGYTVVVGGLELVTQAEATSQVPLLGDVPLLGEAFKSRSNSESRSRFFVFIRAGIMRHQGFEDLKFVSDADVAAARIDDGWPVVEPRIIR